MGIAVVLIVYAVVLGVLAALGSILLSGLAHVLTRRSGPRHRQAVIASALFPLACVVFAGGWLATYWIVNELVFHRDPILGDTWETPLPNGYALMMIDTTEQGTIYNPKSQPGGGLVLEQTDAAFGVRQLQVSRNSIFGARDAGYFGRIGEDSTYVDSYFGMDDPKHTNTVRVA